jgi:hypothetical protein
MSTRAVIARETRPDQFRGRHHHSDRYPSGLGRALLLLYRGHYGGPCVRDIMHLQRMLIDEHPAGWNSIVGDWDAPIGFGSVRSPQCYCHGERREKPHQLTQRTAVNSGCEFAYVLGRCWI